MSVCIIDRKNTKFLLNLTKHNVSLYYFIAKYLVSSYFFHKWILLSFFLVVSNTLKSWSFCKAILGSGSWCHNPKTQKVFVLQREILVLPSLIYHLPSLFQMLVCHSAYKHNFHFFVYSNSMKTFSPVKSIPLDSKLFSG